jgi:hypothetical protein
MGEEGDAGVVGPKNMLDARSVRIEKMHVVV